jgi:hypothetical protein
MKMLRKTAVTLICMTALSACGPSRWAQLEKQPDSDILAKLREGGDEKICKAGFIDAAWASFVGPRVQEIARREAALRQLGDCSEEHKKCIAFGFALGTPGYSECRVTLEGIEAQAKAARSASNSIDAFNTQLLIQSLQPRPAPSINCTSSAFGGIVNTHCQ